MANVADMAGACSNGLPKLHDLDNTLQKPWFALRVREKLREHTELQLRSRVASLFSPTIIQTRRWSDRFKVIKVPVFPGYLFAQFELDKRVDILKVLGVIDLVRVGARPAEVDRDEIAALQRAFAAALPIEPLPQMMLGQAVRVIGGPMAGVEGTLAMVKAEMKLVLSVTMMNRAVAVEIDQALVAPI